MVLRTPCTLAVLVLKVATTWVVFILLCISKYLELNNKYIKLIWASQKTYKNHIQQTWENKHHKESLSVRQINIHQNTLKLPGDLGSIASNFSHAELFISKNQQHKASISSFLNNGLHTKQHSKSFVQEKTILWKNTFNNITTSELWP